ncbi:hypothetical protein [Clostridium cochlearium]|uniref:Uncharacterized protein n=1 Tax=Clostridium cochlearium TaxID=1494 RepID=A0A2X2WCD2_CLOCO|nr:hypothetical protein [Clostridium cochlearium]MBU5268911.1 hypothetical protein [Clostridium cochlearium]SQB33695.1 Uncharacterised protein [Clostridium cochlearium]
MIDGIPILLCNFIVILLLTDIRNFSELLLSFDRITFVIKYILLTLASTVSVSIFWSFISPIETNKVINFIRKKKNLDEIGVRSTTWDEFFNDGSEFKAIAIYKNGKEITKGFLKNWNLDPQDDKEILLEREEVFEEHPECFETIEKNYYNASKDILIKEYNLDKLYSKLDENN